MGTKRRFLRVNLFEQFANSRALRKLKLQLVNSKNLTQLRVKLHPYVHWFGCSTNSFLSTPMYGRFRYRSMKSSP
jgi:hypothetical protein